MKKFFPALNKYSNHLLLNNAAGTQIPNQVIKTVNNFIESGYAQPFDNNILSKINLDKILSEMAGKEYSFLKTRLTEAIIEEIIPVGKEINKLLNNKTHLQDVLKKGSEKANIIAEENLKNIRDIVGLI